MYPSRAVPGLSDIEIEKERQYAIKNRNRKKDTQTETETDRQCGDICTNNDSAKFKRVLHYQKLI